ncbi:MAG: M14 family zinc carboxypeptidase [Longimicrobiales bacterium]|nr:M14 family zinc carboxypeptidase [Longimicrobiales bacterium]
MRVLVRMLALAAIGLSTMATPTTAQVEWAAAAEGYPRTAAEMNGFTAHTRHLEMWDYLHELSAVSPDMYLGTYGETRLGRELPYAIFSRPLVSEPWEAKALGRPVLLFAANVHGDERTFREGLLVLMRDLATPGTSANDLLDEVTLVVVPQINPDGFEASQEGQRGNVWGLDLNRDYVKLEHPSIQNYVQEMIGEWRPHLLIDGHNGGSRPYNLNYQCTSHYDSARELTDICDDEIFPYIDRSLAREGMKSWYYQRGDEEEWRTGGSQIRIGRNYGGMVNTVAILFEAPRQRLEVGARAGYLGYLAVAEWAAENAGHLMSTINDARAETVALGAEPRGQIAVEMEYEAEEEPVSYEIVTGGDGEPEDTVQVTGARLMKRPVATRLRDRPWAYTLPRDAEDAVELLLRHGITVERLTEPVTLQVRAYTIDDVTHERQYNHAAVTRIHVGDVVEQTRELPTGTYVVRAGQMLGRLAAHMLEVETEDNVVYWNRMDAWVPRPDEAGSPIQGEDGDGPPVSPIFKVMTPQTLPAILVERMDVSW